MSFTAQSIIDRAKAKWKESTDGDMLSPANCLIAITDGLIAVRSARPECYQDFYTGFLYEHVDVTDKDQVIYIQDRFREALAAHLIMSGYSGDSDSQNHAELSNEWSARFKKLVESA